MFCRYHFNSSREPRISSSARCLESRFKAQTGRGRRGYHLRCNSLMDETSTMLQVMIRADEIISQCKTRRCVAQRPIMKPVNNLWHLPCQERSVRMHGVSSEHGRSLLGDPLLDILHYFLLHRCGCVLWCEARSGQPRGFVVLNAPLVHVIKHWFFSMNNKL